MTEDRIKMNLSQNSKGQFQIDCTVESTTVEGSAKLLGEAIDSMKAVAREKGLVIVGDYY